MSNPSTPAQPNFTSYRVLLHAIHNALAVPLPTKDRDELTYLRLCRAWLVIAACQRILGDREAGDRDLLIAAEALRDEAADYPPDDYDHERLSR